MTRLNHLKKRFQCNSNLFEKYKETINGLVSSGYARLVTRGEPEVDEDTPVWFLLHHPVSFSSTEAEKSQNRLRLCSQVKGTSLNDQT